MTETNQRNTYRAPFNVRAELFRRGVVMPCLIVNMSAGGMLVASDMVIEQGEQVTLGLRLFDELRDAAGLDYLNFQLEVLEVIPDPAADVTALQYRCRNLTNEGSAAYERAHKVVFESERQRLAVASGAEDSSPMVTGDRRAELKKEQVRRYGKESINPLRKP